MNQLAFTHTQSTEALLPGAQQFLDTLIHAGRFPLNVIYISEGNRFAAVRLDSPVEEELSFQDIFTANNIHVIRYVANHLTEEIVTKLDGVEIARTLDAIKATQGESDCLTDALLHHAITKPPGCEKDRARLLFSKMVEWPENQDDLLLKLLNAFEWSNSACPASVSAYKQAAVILRAFDQAGLPPTGSGFCPEGGVGMAWSNERVSADVECYNDGTSEFGFRVRGEKTKFLPVDAFNVQHVHQAVERVRRLHAD